MTRHRQREVENGDRSFEDRARGHGLDGRRPLLVSAAKADVEMEPRGSVAYLHSYRLQPGDAQTVRAFLEGPEAQGVRIIYMDSRGGNQRVAMRIGQMIREHGIDTGFDPRGGEKCVSACTIMFVGGVHRYYVGGSRIRDAANTRYGLGFHPSKHPRPELEAAVDGYFDAMGAPGQARLRYHLYPRDRLDEPFQGIGPRGIRVLYFTGSRTAVRAGVATGTVAPPGERD